MLLLLVEVAYLGTEAPLAIAAAPTAPTHDIILQLVHDFTACGEILQTPIFTQAFTCMLLPAEACASTQSSINSNSSKKSNNGK